MFVHNKTLGILYALHMLLKAGAPFKVFHAIF